MGVRFECPHGHKLHVKAHLSGQCGICPECGVRFIVPSFSGGRVAEAPAADALSPEGDVTASIESTAAFNAGLSQSLPAAAGDGVQWYVRPVEGGQYGPADTDSFRQWIAEGRVPTGAWVWRTGWADWKKGGEAVETFAAERTRTSPPPMPPARAPFRDPTPAKAQAPAPAAVTARAAVPTFEMGDALHPAVNGQAPAAKPVDAIYAARRRRKQRNAWLTLALGTVAIMLLVVLVVVLNRPRGDVAPADGNSTAGTPAASAPAE